MRRLKSENLEKVQLRGNRFGERSNKPKVLEDGVHVEKAAVQYTYSKEQASAAATERNQSLTGKSFEAASVSMIIHPRNPFVPTFHANLRFFVVDDDHRISVV